jgi:hypothetical protein
MRPHPAPQGADLIEGNFNKSLSCGRNGVGTAFGILVRKFRLYNRRMQLATCIYTISLQPMAMWNFMYKTRLHLVTNSLSFSPQSKYTDWAPATCQRNLVPTFSERVVSPGQRGGSPMVVNLSLLDRNPTFLSKCSSFIRTRLSGPRSRSTTAQKIWQDPESNPGPVGLQPGTLTTRPQRRSRFKVIHIIISIQYHVKEATVRTLLFASRKIC